MPPASIGSPFARLRGGPFWVGDPFDQGPLWGMKNGSRQEVRATVVGFESGPLLAIIQGI